MSLERLEALAAPNMLANFGTLALKPEDELGAGTLVLLGPSEPGFWAHVTSEPEFQDGAPDPMDRWSTRVISDLAAKLGGRAVFPFGHPLQPFLTWALRSGRAWSSPVGILVHDQAGLMVSYRGAVVLPDVTAAPPKSIQPCESCASKPCLGACPPAALTASGYDVPACHDFLDQAEGRTCLTRGCAVRRSCPISLSYGRLDAQSAYHMGLFHK